MSEGPGFVSFILIMMRNKNDHHYHQLYHHHHILVDVFVQTILFEEHPQEFVIVVACLPLLIDMEHGLCDARAVHTCIVFGSKACFGGALSMHQNQRDNVAWPCVMFNSTTIRVSVTIDVKTV